MIQQATKAQKSTPTQQVKVTLARRATEDVLVNGKGINDLRKFMSNLCLDVAKEEADGRKHDAFFGLGIAVLVSTFHDPTV